jgi:pimeloyl-ACP methyl ester carboxylesterase
MKTKYLVLLSTGILIIVFFTVIHIKYRQDLSRSFDRINSFETQVFKSVEYDIEYILKGNGPTILISHGVTGGIDQGIGLSDRYLDKGYRLLYISRFGYLNSSFPDHPSAKLQAEAYKDLLEYLDIDSVFILGNSAGGASALHFAIDYPEKCQGLILVSSIVPRNDNALPPKPFMKAVFGSDFLYWTTIKLFGRSMLHMFVPVTIDRDISKLQRDILIEEVFLSCFPVSKRTKGILFDTYVSNPSVNKELAYDKIKSPTLIIHAIDDPAPPVEGARFVSGKICNSELITFETGGHLILNHEKEIRNIINNFILR